MIFGFFLPPVYLFFVTRRFAAGRRGILIGVLFVAAFLASGMVRQSFLGSLVQAVMFVWIAQFLPLCIVTDLARLVRRAFTRRPLKFRTVSLLARALALFSAALTVAFYLYGVPHSLNFCVRSASIGLPAGAKPFTAVFFSDTHLDPLSSKAKFERFAAEVDSLAPDILIFGGDLADVFDTVLTAEGYDEIFRKLAKIPKYGAFAVVGNHEAYMERNGSDPAGWMASQGFTVLIDSSACTPVACFTGRIDFHVARSRGTPRTPLAEILPADSTLPWILLDHQPRGLGDDYVGKAPLIALSGHTHKGQFFPGPLLIGLIWELAYGFGELGGAPWFVTSGLDGWGPPIRVGSDTEMWFFRFEPKLN